MCKLYLCKATVPERIVHTGRKLAKGCIAALFLLCYQPTRAQDSTVVLPGNLKLLSLEELMNIEVSLVSRTPGKLTEAPSAIQVITNDAIRRSGATNIPEALRLVSNLQVAQVNANAWLISSRGFNTIFANKLLVMIDGRTVYTPLFGGVLWELQNLLLEDVDRIEVVSGPGGTLWGANAVNGVINIVTKSTTDTKGLYASASAGSLLRNNVQLRYGGHMGKLTYRVYGQSFYRNPTLINDSTENADAWRLAQGGFRADWEGKRDVITVQGDYYCGRKKQNTLHSDFDGQNIRARWQRVFSPSADMTLQVYADRYYREDNPSLGSDKMNTVDVDFQQRFPLHQKHSFMYGVGARLVKDEADYTKAVAGIMPVDKRLDLFSAFLQDEYAMTQHLKLTIGTKVLHNVYTGIEWQPSARIAFVPSTKQTIWAAVSRAVRTPSRFDVDYFLPQFPVPPTSPSVAGGPNFVSEKLYAYELGYRVQPDKRSTFSIAAFYNVYNDMYSVEALPGTLTYQLQNGSEGKSWGAEVAATYRPFEQWQLRGSYTFFDKKLAAKPGHNFNPDYLGNDARHQAVVQSMIDLPLGLQLDATWRYVHKLQKTLATSEVPSYFAIDVRLAYRYRWIELSVVGKNVNLEQHAEFQTLRIPRSIYGKIAVRL